ncbi:MAG: hypothetical protein J0I00_14645 [Burkholderiales bacterium]|uniref:6-phosphogluconate dehydrogenase NADP-binding domain-containing protein n=1 Tax=Ottowia pentelensis TaxID=511108 RepID=A0ABV6PXB5_9BURK|nr:hypothetical protein [Ottowia sp.]MBN9406645.1 hypothetical protein [Burkholderiales bacterium]MBS0404689.1 hypothetical protein [Pseudomonadota bacterium]MBS0413379.1 hypothetical protein [Pseudomonadota bacterium]HMN57168.1 hypothetical protein [Ottowia sp.]
MTIQAMSVIGTGNLGAPMVRNARRGRFGRIVCDRNPAVGEPGVCARPFI